MKTKKRKVVTASLNESQIEEYEQAKKIMTEQMYTNPQQFEIKDSEFVKYLVSFYIQEQKKRLGGENDAL